VSGRYGTNYDGRFSRVENETYGKKSVLYLGTSTLLLRTKFAVIGRTNNFKNIYIYLNHSHKRKNTLTFWDSKTISLAGSKETNDFLGLIL
jgi:hypothetical protein